MTKKAISVWVYDDEGASELSVKSALTTAQAKLSANYTIEVCTISSKDILDNKLDDETQDLGILIMPGGADLPYCKKLNGIGNDIIRDFVHRGNLYIGICAGGYYGARGIEFLGQGYEITGARELAFFSGTAIGSIKSFTNGQLYDEKLTSKAVITLDYADTNKDDVYYHGGAYFLADENAVFNTLATYSNGKNAVITGGFGQGQYLLSGVHFELCPEIYEQYAVAQADEADIEQETHLLSIIRHKHYGSLIYKEIERMINKVLS
ncbi:BPL-N domain-containing protein [Psychrobacter glacincola]|uniref:BPL-N domain-containing protein n=1 Tax=Psychrobacter glacincola TaxID=56810 RepID=UPI003D0958B9